MIHAHRESLYEMGIELHGVRLNLHLSYDQLFEHTRALMAGYVRPVWPNPHLDVTGHWLLEHGDKTTSRFAGSDELDGFGKRMRLNEDQLVWVDTYRDPDLQLRFGRTGDAAAFDVSFCYQPTAKKLAKYPDYEHKKFFDLLRYLVLFPIAWHLERTLGWALVHASAVADGERAILVAGPGGSGKTTTCVALMAQAEMRLVTENLLFTDGACVAPLPEPIRLTDESLALLGNHTRGLSPVDYPGGLKGKTLYRPDGMMASTAARPAAIFIPRFSKTGFVRRLEPAVACELLWAANRLTLELNDYYWYTAALDLLWPAAGNAQRQLDVLKRLTETTPCYALGIDRAAGVDPVVRRIVETASGAQSVSGEIV